MIELPRSSPGSPFRLILAGVGFWGRTWIGVIGQSPHWELAALVDSDEATLGRAAAAAGVLPDTCFNSIADAVQVVEADAALIVVPPAAHAQIAREALECGLHCLVEKPFATKLADARSIVEQADSIGTQVMVNQQYRHRAGAQTVKRLLNAGAIGRIGVAHITFTGDLPVPGIAFQHKMEEPLLFDMAVHHFDLIRGVLGVEPTRVQAVSFNPSWSQFAGNAAATVVLEVGEGPTITYIGNWASRGRPTGWDGVWEIVGESGSICWDGDKVLISPLARPLRAKIHRRALGREWNGHRVRLDRVEEVDRLGSLAEFRSAIRENREAETAGRDNIRSLALVVAAVESARRRAAVDVAEVLADDS
jgi:predicted dehydrogenase